MRTWRVACECPGETEDRARARENEADDQVNKYEGCERENRGALNLEGLHSCTIGYAVSSSGGRGCWVQEENTISHDSEIF